MKTVKLEDALQLENIWKLCYVDEIPDTYTDWDPKSKEIRETPEYKDFIIRRNKELDIIKDARKDTTGYSYLSSYDYDTVETKLDPDHKFKTRVCEYPNPEYEEGYTHYLYFTDNIDKQWGDDWNDAPYEYNAGCPYDHETNIIIVPVSLVEDDNIIIKLPKDYGYNSPFSVDLINAGAIPWIFAYTASRKCIPTSISIIGGECIQDVLNSINTINKWKSM